ncbi:MAG: hypothetical protein R2932_50425 [Caldilineaceae bacterium]
MIPLPMGLNLILLTLVIVASVITILQTARDSVTNSPRWIPISIALIAAAIGSLIFFPATAGYLSTSLWILFAVVPSIGFRISNHYYYRGRYHRSRRLKAWLRWLHPLQDWGWQNALFQVQIYLQEGAIDKAIHTLEAALQKTDGTPEREVLLFTISHDWHGLIAWWESHPEPQLLAKRPDVIRHYLRACGEVGALNKMVDTFLQYQSALDKVHIMLDFAHLYLFAFGGKIDEISLLLNARLLENLNPDAKVIWLATAHYAAGKAEIGRALLQPLLRTVQDGATRRFIEQRLSHEPLLAHVRSTVLASALRCHHARMDETVPNSGAVALITPQKLTISLQQADICHFHGLDK